MTYKKRSDLAVKMIGDELVIIDPKIGKAVHRLNDVALFIWELIDHCSVETIVTKMVDEFEVTAEEAKSDIMNFANELESLKLIEKAHE